MSKFVSVNFLLLLVIFMWVNSVSAQWGWGWGQPVAVRRTVVNPWLPWRPTRVRTTVIRG